MVNDIHACFLGSHVLHASVYLLLDGSASKTANRQGNCEFQVACMGVPALHGLSDLCTDSCVFSHHDKGSFTGWDM